jgi:hypothetical protein
LQFNAEVKETMEEKKSAVDFPLNGFFFFNYALTLIASANQMEKVFR